MKHSYVLLFELDMPQNPSGGPVLNRLLSRVLRCRLHVSTCQTFIVVTFKKKLTTS